MQTIDQLQNVSCYGILCCGMHEILLLDYFINVMVDKRILETIICFPGNHSVP